MDGSPDRDSKSGRLEPLVVLIGHEHDDEQDEGIEVDRSDEGAEEDADADGGDQGRPQVTWSEEGEEDSSAIERVDGNQIEDGPEEIGHQEIPHDELSAPGELVHRGDDAAPLENRENGPETEAKDGTGEGDGDVRPAGHFGGTGGGGGPTKGLQDDFGAIPEALEGQGVAEFVPEDGHEDHEDPGGQVRDHLRSGAERLTIQEEGREPEEWLHGHRDPEQPEA